MHTTRMRTKVRRRKSCLLILGLFTLAAVLAQIRLFRLNATSVGDSRLEFVDGTASPLGSNEREVSWKLSSCSNSTSDAAILDDKCLLLQASSLARVWKKKSYANSKWCVPASHQNLTDTLNPDDSPSLVLIKVPKSASSTVAGMMLSAAHRGRCQHDVQWQHKPAREYGNRSDSFVVAPIRNPDKRALSHVYYHKVSFHRKDTSDMQQDRTSPRDPFILSELDKASPNYILKYTASQTFNDDSDFDKLREIVRDTMERYDFMIVVERIDESIVALSHVSDIPVGHFVTFPSKQSNSWYRAGGSENTKCVPLVAPIVTEAIKARWQTTRWKRRHYGDALLHAAANASLDRTLQQIGYNVVERQLQELTRLRALVQASCASETFFPCSAEGKLQVEASQKSCFVRDFGCGYECIDRVLAASSAK